MVELPSRCPIERVSTGLPCTGRSAPPLGLVSATSMRGDDFVPKPIPEPMKEFEVRPDPDDPRLSVTVPGIDHEGRAVETAVVTERPLTLFLNAREIVTMMDIGDRPDLLGVGYLLNQNMLKSDDEIAAVEYEEDISTVVVRTRRQTNFEDKLKKKIQT